MRHDIPDPTPRRYWLLTLLSAAMAAMVSACKNVPIFSPTRPAAPETPATVGPAASPQGAARSSNASTARAYRQDGASHIYGLNTERIYKGKMPAMLYAVGVLNVEIDRAGQVTRLDWLRAPRHAPEVMAEIEKTVHQASPFPAPTRLGKVVYTDTWLWHKNGKFQLDTLTEGQD